MNQTKMFQADMFGGSAIAATAAPTRPQAPAQQSTMFDAALTGAAADLVSKGQVPPAYRSILALAELDSNRQALAVEALGTGRISTPGAFRAYCAQLGKSQADEAAEKPAGALLLGVVAESAILPDAADVAPVAALDGDLQAMDAPVPPKHLTRTRRAPQGCCRLHKVPFVPRPLARQSTEVRWCGDWWDCPAPGCGSSVLIPSEGLAAQLASMKRGSPAQS